MAFNSDSTAIWPICGCPGKGKSTLFNELTGKKRETTPNSAASTNSITAMADAKYPVRGIGKFNHCRFVDCEGVGDAQSTTQNDILRSLTPSLIRILSGASGLIICLEPMGRVLNQDTILIKAVIVAAGPDVPIILCYTKYDEKIRPGSAKLPGVTKADVADWIAGPHGASEACKLFEINTANVESCMISIALDDINELIPLLRKPLFENETLRIERARAGVTVQEDITEENYDRLLNLFQGVAEVVVSMPWWEDLLRGIPVIGTIISAISIVRRFFQQGQSPASPLSPFSASGGK